MAESKSAARNSREDLIEQIVAETDASTDEKKRALARRIALAGNTLKWSDFDLTVLLAKADPRKYPGIKNYSVLVNGAIRVTGAKSVQSQKAPNYLWFK